MEINIAFTDELLSQLPQQRAPRFSIQASALHLPQYGDAVRIEGISTDIPMAVVGRSWTFAQDEMALAIVIGCGAATL